MKSLTTRDISDELLFFATRVPEIAPLLIRYSNSDDLEELSERITGLVLTVVSEQNEVNGIPLVRWYMEEPISDKASAFCDAERAMDQLVVSVGVNFGSEPMIIRRWVITPNQVT